MSQHRNAQSAWFSDYGIPQNGAARIFAFPYSGAGSTAFFKWAQDLRDTDIDFLGVCLPGRETRLREPVINHLPDVIAQLVPAITPLLDKPYIFYGHSMGSLLAFELARALQVNHLPMPKQLFIAAFRAPNRPSPNRVLHRLSDKDFIDAIKSYGGTSQAIFDNPELVELFMPVLRGDFSLHENYQYKASPLLNCPITTFSGSEDPFAKPDFMALWQEQTQAAFSQIIYQGGHFFLHDHRVAILRRLQQELMGVESF